MYSLTEKLLQKFKIPTMTPTGKINNCLVLRSNEIVAHLKLCFFYQLNYSGIERRKTEEAFEIFKTHPHKILCHILCFQSVTTSFWALLREFPIDLSWFKECPFLSFYYYITLSWWSVSFCLDQRYRIKVMSH